MDEKTIVEMSLMVRETRVLNFKLKKILEEYYFENTRCSFNRRVESRMVIERLSNSIEVLADLLRLPPYDPGQSFVENFLGRRRKQIPTGFSSQTPDGHSG